MRGTFGVLMWHCLLLRLSDVDVSCCLNKGCIKISPLIWKSDGWHVNTEPPQDLWIWVMAPCTAGIFTPNADGKSVKKTLSKPGFHLKFDKNMCLMHSSTECWQWQKAEWKEISCGFSSPGRRWWHVELSGGRAGLAPWETVWGNNHHRFYGWYVRLIS